MKSDLIRKIVIATFLSVPAVSSVISTIHLIDLFNLGNPTWLSILLAVTFELGSIASLLAISVIEKIKTGAIWFIFFILAGLQIIGNVYYSYSFTSDQLISNPTFLTNFMDLFSFITGEEIRDVKIFLACIIGIPIPLIALFFLKSNIDYLRPNREESVISGIETAISNADESPAEKVDVTDETSNNATPLIKETILTNDPRVEGIEKAESTIPQVPVIKKAIEANEPEVHNQEVINEEVVQSPSNEQDSQNIEPATESSKDRIRHPMISSRRFS